MKKGLIALSPLVVFIVLYVVTSIIARDFYKVPITVAFMVASGYAIIISGGKPLRKRIDIYSRGAATDQMMLMIWIFILAGAFAHSAKVMGAIDATVNLSLTLLPGNMLLAGLFLAACFISLSVGTSVGTIVALSFISDTTIVATSTQGCKLSDKFRVNSFIVIPAAFVVLMAYIFLGTGIQTPTHIPDVSYIKVIPYLAVLITACAGMNVTAVLTLGIILTGIIGIVISSYDLFGWFNAMGEGIKGMGELIIITMMAGGLLEVIKDNGGIDFIINRLTRHVSTKRGAELAVAGLVSFVNFCTANNTVAILTVGGIAKQIGDRFGVDNRKCASILDTFSCTIQGIIPYGAQLLMAAGLAQLNPVSILPYLYYPLIIGIAALLSIIFRYPKRYS